MINTNVTIKRHELNRLLVMGELMAVALNNIADDIDASSGINRERLERLLPTGWNLQAMSVRRLINEPAGRLS